MLREAIRADPTSIRARANFALGLGRQGRHAEAEAAYREALGIADHPALHRGLGVSVYWQGRPVDAETAFRRAIALKPDYVRAHCDLGELYAEQGRLVEAETAYRTAIALKPDSLTALTALPGVLLAAGRHAAAEAAARAALELNFEVARAHFDLWAALEARRDWAALAVATAEFLARRPEHADARARLARARAELARVNAPPPTPRPVR